MKFFSVISRVIKAFAYIAGAAVLLMMVITAADVFSRIFSSGITGAYDLVRACGVIAVACGLPYLTAVKGHIAIEFFYHKSSKAGRIVMDLIIRIASMVIFGLLAVQAFKHGMSLFSKGEVFANLGLPVFWIPFLISINCVLMMVVFVYHMIHPGKEYIEL